MTQEKLLLAIFNSLEVMEAIQKALMKAPVSLLLYRYKYCRFVRADIPEGIVLERLF